MTGFGESAASGDGLNISVSIRSVNSRFLELNVRIPELLSNFEGDILAAIKGRVSRGKVMTTVLLDSDTKKDLYNVFLDRSLIENYILELSSISGISGEMQIGDILSLPNVVNLKPRDDLHERVKSLIDNAVGLALDKLEKMRVSEGMAIEADLRNRFDEIEKKIEKLSGRVELSRESYMNKLRNRIGELIEGRFDFDDDRIAQEAAFLAQKSDPSEELTRLHSHLKQFRDALDGKESVGSKLKFILQECNREIDTTGAKGDDAATGEIVISIKEQLERIREQVQNVE